MNVRSRLRFVSVGLGLALVAGACTSAGASPSGAAATGGGVTVTGAWARTSTGMDRAGAAYVAITNGSGQDDALIGVVSPAAKTVELHETVELPMESPAPAASDMAMGAATPAPSGVGGMMAMRPVQRIPLPAGSTVELKPGGYHMMLIELTGPLEVGKTIELTLRFEKAPPVTVTAEIRGQ